MVDIKTYRIGEVRVCSIGRHRRIVVYLRNAIITLIGNKNLPVRTDSNIRRLVEVACNGSKVSL